MPVVRRLTAAEAEAAVPHLAALLEDCVDGGASVSFQPPLDRRRLEAYWRKVAAEVAAGTAILVVAERGGDVVGTAHVQFAGSDNQPHRGEVNKMLVHRSARRHGLGARLLAAVEREAKAAGKTLLTLDTQSGSAGDRLYTAGGWVRVGEIPGFALTPAGNLCATTVFYKQL